MAAPIKEQILDNVKTTLEGITTANGYDTNVTWVSRNRSDPRGDGHDRYILIRVDPENHDPEVTMGYSHRHLMLSLEVFITDMEDPTETLEYFAADIEKALMVDHTRGALAIDTTIESVDIPYHDDESDADITGLAVVTVDIHYRTLVEDPYT